MKELAEEPHVSAFRVKYEAGRSFDLEDDMEFCPGLLTEVDVSTAQCISSHTEDPWLGRGSRCTSLCLFCFRFGD
jgi:hypothetical protein